MAHSAVPQLKCTARLEAYCIRLSASLRRASAADKLLPTNRCRLRGSSQFGQTQRICYRLIGGVPDLLCIQPCSSYTVVAHGIFFRLFPYGSQQDLAHPSNASVKAHTHIFYRTSCRNCPPVSTRRAAQLGRILLSCI